MALDAVFLSSWQPPVPPVMTRSATWHPWSQWHIITELPWEIAAVHSTRHGRFGSVWVSLYVDLIASLGTLRNDHWHYLGICLTYLNSVQQPIEFIQFSSIKIRSFFPHNMHNSHHISHSWGQDLVCLCHDDAITWKCFSQHWPFVRGINRQVVSDLKRNDVTQWCDVTVTSVL